MMQQWLDAKYAAKELDRRMRDLNSKLSSMSGELGADITSLEMIKTEIYGLTPESVQYSKGDIAGRLGNLITYIKRLQEALAVGPY